MTSMLLSGTLVVGLLTMLCSFTASANEDVRLCNGERLSAFTTGEPRGWAPFFGKWRGMRTTNNPHYPGADEEVTISFEPKAGVAGDDGPSVFRLLTRKVIVGTRTPSSFSYGNYLATSVLVGAGLVEGTAPNLVVMRIDGSTLHYVGYSKTSGCVVMDLTHTAE
ncbi:MAG: hypothetical protein AAGH74_13080 [Pseudomonadota bacterium]